MRESFFVVRASDYALLNRQAVFWTTRIAAVVTNVLSFALDPQTSVQKTYRSKALADDSCPPEIRNLNRKEKCVMNREILEKPFAPEQIKRRQGTNGDVLDYIEGCAVIQRLNECFDAEWIFDIHDHRVYDDEVVVLGKLTLQGISKSQFGKSRITRSKKDNSIISLGDDLKAAATDCLKKCATLFGVGLHLYFDAPQSIPNGTGNGNGSPGNGEHRSNGSHGNGSDSGRLTARQLSA